MGSRPMRNSHSKADLFHIAAWDGIIVMNRLDEWSSMERLVGSKVSFAAALLIHSINTISVTTVCPTQFGEVASGHTCSRYATELQTKIVHAIPWKVTYSQHWAPCCLELAAELRCCSAPRALVGAGLERKKREGPGTHVLVCGTLHCKVTKRSMMCGCCVALVARLQQKRRKGWSLKKWAI